MPSELGHIVLFCDYALFSMLSVLVVISIWAGISSNCNVRKRNVERKVFFKLPKKKKTSHYVPSYIINKVLVN